VGAGLTYEEVAAKLGYKNRGTVHRIVHDALQTEQAESVQFLREVEGSRLDALQSSIC
jgi:hypothetical protein